MLNLLMWALLGLLAHRSGKGWGGEVGVNKKKFERQQLKRWVKLNCVKAELQIRGDIEDNSKISFLISQ